MRFIITRVIENGIKPQIATHAYTQARKVMFMTLMFQRHFHRETTAPKCPFPPAAIHYFPTQFINRIIFVGIVALFPSNPPNPLTTVPICALGNCPNTFPNNFRRELISPTFASAALLHFLLRWGLPIQREVFFYVVSVVAMTRHKGAQ